MSQKRSSDCTSDSSSKKHRKQLTLKEKLDILERYDNGARAVDISKSLDLPGSTVRSIIQQSSKIKEFAKLATPMNAKCLFKNNRSPIMVDMERVLSAWIEYQTINQVPLNTQVIQEKARSIYEDLKKDYDDSSNIEPFKASLGWFERFKRRAGFNNVSVNVEVSSADTNAASEYNNQLCTIIEEGGYTPQQVFNVDETGLFWKRMPSRTFLSREEKTITGYKASMDRLTLLLGGNAAGDFKIKPLLVYHTTTPNALKGFSIGSLPVIWKANKKAWVTQAVFDEWFNYHFCPAVTNFCAANNLPNKALLILDNSPCHSPTLTDLKDNIKVLFLPPHITPILQPMDQGVIYSFKAYYHRRIFTEAIRVTEVEGGPSLEEFWRDYDIKKAIDNISAAWNEVKSSNMNNVWKNLWPECVSDFVDFEEPVVQISKDIAEMGKQIGLNDLEDDDVQDLLASHAEELSVHDMEHQRPVSEEDDGQEHEEHAVTLTAKHISDALRYIEEGLAILDQNDPNRERSSSVNRIVNKAIDCYRELYKEKKKTTMQLSSDQVFKSSPKGSSNQSQPDSSSRELNCVRLKCSPEFHMPDD